MAAIFGFLALGLFFAGFFAPPLWIAMILCGLLCCAFDG